MVVCTFFQQGRCKFGDRCKFEHPGKSTGASGNRFGAISGGFGDIPLRKNMINPMHHAPSQATVLSKSNSRFTTGQSQTQQAPDPAVKASDIKSDLTAGQGRPEWIFSAYAPHKDVARQLFGGAHRERSMEEMRLRHYELAAAGNLNQAVQEASALWQECVQQMEISLNDLNGAVKYVNDGRNEHPNRIDIIQGKTQTSVSQAPAPFGQPSTFGQPSPFGQQNVAPTPTAPGAFGAPSSTFGQTSGLGQSGGFGRASAPAQPAGMGQSTAFGQTSALGGSAFGQTSTLGGQSAFNKTPFGQPALSQPGVNPSPFGAPSVVSPFTQVAQNQPAAGGFGQIAGQPAPSPFGQTAGQPAPSPFGQAAVNPSPFGQPSAPAGAAPFGQPSAPAGAAPFGQPSAPAGAAPFGAPSTASPFTQVSQNQPTTGGFGQSAVQPAPSPFGQPAVQGVPVQNVNAGPRAYIKIDNPQDLNPLPQLDGETRHNPSTKQLVMWKGRPVKYINEHPCYLHPQDNKTFVRVNFPNGPPDPASLKDAHGKPEEYTPEVAEAYQFFLQNGYFKDGNIPAVPPKQEWLSFDF
ncbi:Zinc finger, CCCH-type [Penicillium griseofulvum]|uniref:Zinc finger, CCCH-type n=1 Tax=Penicillium patulum TaxID=5078 RepID=A0A135LAK5_PENPA|nr:Zinc finger, CCCH-type [Penicillium griseofulvum]KXG45981.1 Zinc finger, CCCH-type [Penicillium griseofulvum]